MKTPDKLKIALTFDDAPSIDEPDITCRPERMDKVIPVLKKYNIEHCTAFVIGKSAIGNEKYLEHWLDAGYQLGNHSFTHEHCSQLTAKEFKNSVVQCDKVLESVNAFKNTGEKWFRFPFLDVGKGSEQREEFKSILADLGYKIAYASLCFYDEDYELPLQKAMNTNSTKDIENIGSRYINSVLHNLEFMSHMYHKHYNKDVKHITYAHFGGVTEVLLDNLLSRLESKNIEWCDLSSASKCPVYTDFETKSYSNGLLLELHKLPALSLRIKRKFKRLSTKYKLFGQDKYGPIWPYLQ